MPTVKFHTLGCKVNQYDTQSIRERFLEHGFKEECGSGKAGLYLINTCTVTSAADQKSRAAIRRCINENPKAKIIVTGCLVKNDSRQLAKIKGISFIVSKSFFAEGISGFHSHTRAFLKIQDGCDNSCAYCKVPLVRGRSRSRPLEEIIREARALVKNGFKEIVLTGICLGSYGKGLDKEIGLVEVIEELEKINGLLRLRLSSIEAGDVSDRLIEKMSKSKKLCRHLHIPIQSGDNEILKKMRRRYTRGYYLKLIKKIKQKIPGLSLTTDCLVGFPGETERHFRNTLSLVKRIIPLKVHIFPYSRREGTCAGSKLCDRVAPLIIKKRIDSLKKCADLCAKDYKKSFLGARVPVLFEGESKEIKGYWEGYTDNYIRVLLKSRRRLKNKLCFVRLKAIFGDCMLDKIPGRCYKYKSH